MNPRVGRADEALEHWVGLMRFAVEFGMELAGDEEGVFGYFDDFDQFAIGSITAEAEASLLELFAVGVIEFVAMAVAFVHDESAVEASGFCADDELAGLRAEAHGAALFCDSGLLVEHCDDGVRRIGIKFG